MSEFLKETDKLLGKAVKSLNDNLFTDTDKGVNGQEEEKESSTSSQEEVEKPTQKKTAPSTSEQSRLKEEYKEPTVWDCLADEYKEKGNDFIYWLFSSKTGLVILACVIAFVLLWIFAGFWWAVGIAALCLIVKIVWAVII